MKIYTVELSRQAERELDGLLAYLAEAGGELVVMKYIRLFDRKFKQLTYTGSGMPLISGYEDKYDNLRRVHIKKYVIFYTIEEKRAKILIVHIVYGGVDIEKLLRE